MTAGGDSRSLFVVQRAFRRVRRGYDPEEVDRHLELVSGWLRGSGVGQAIQAARAEVAARDAEVESWREEAREALEGARAEADATVHGAQLRAAAETGAA